MKSQKIWRMVFAFLLLALIVWLLWFFGTSDPFGHCIHQRKDYQPYQALHKESLFFVKVGIRLNLNAACAVHVTNLYQGAITALAGIVVAFFTGTLWWVTYGMVRIAKDQRVDTLRAVEASESAALAAQSAAEATQKSVGLIPVFERAYVSLLFTKRIDTPFFQFDASFSNYGKTPAVLRDLHICFNVENLPTIPDYTNGATSAMHSIVSPDGNFVIGVGGIPAPAQIFYVYGYFRYVDIFKETRTTWFAVQPNMMIVMEGTIGATVVGGDAYNHYD
jgi:hypothetical protein